jgi:hypothetical protein
MVSRNFIYKKCAFSLSGERVFIIISVKGMRFDYRYACLA